MIRRYLVSLAAETAQVDAVPSNCLCARRRGVIGAVMTLSRLQHLLERAAGGVVACIGDVMLDRYVYGTVERVSPEAPIPVMTHGRESEMLGGAGNVARNLAALGAEVRLAGVVGQDAAAAALGRLLDQEDRLMAQLIVEPQRPTTVKTRFVAAGQQLLRVDAEGAGPLEAQTDEQLTGAAASAVAGADAVLLSDYAKGALSGSVIAACLEAAQARSARVIVDPKGTDFEKYGPVDVIKPNARELALATGKPVESALQVEEALAVALSRCQAKAILVTRASAGMSLLVRGGVVRHFHGAARQVFDVSGAGDTALAALGAAVAAGADLEEATEFALLASGVAVGKVGTAIVTPGELIDAELAHRAARQDLKIASFEDALACARTWRERGLKIGFTNGCFDILHRGHVTYLSEARRNCDRLIVAVNTDASVRALKGDGRPVNDLESRAVVLASLSSVDLVLPFDAPTPIALIEAIGPDVLLKGADYTVETVVGAGFVQARGGAVVLVPLVDGVSTTATIHKLTANR